MRLLKIYIPDFRCLKNVEINFEQDISPQVFPIGGQNGSGKSTLLQLIFVLLHCSVIPERFEFLNNTIKHMKRPHEKWELKRYDIATMELLYQNQKIELEFFVDHLSDYGELDIHLRAIVNKKKRIQNVEPEIILVKDVLDSENSYKNKTSNISSFNFLQNKTPSESEIAKRKYEDIIRGLKYEIKDLESKAEQFVEGLELILLSMFELSVEEQNYGYGIFCKSSHNDYKFIKDVLSYANNHVFLAGQPSQTYIFLNDNAMQEIFKREGNYEGFLLQTRKSLPNFYNYNHLSVLEILEAFKKAKEKDWGQAVETIEYGNTFQSLVEELKTIIGGEKYIFPSKELDAINVRYKAGENNYLELGPEDLSHGELKRASLYSWIKHKEINNSIVLIDEIENGLHPDWQYEIVRDLASWGDNQYILATHSFYLCEALTPRHVKELEPPLTDPIAQIKKHAA